MAQLTDLQAKLNQAHGRMMEQLPKNVDTGEVDYENGEWENDEAQAKYKAAAAEVNALNTQMEVYNTLNRAKTAQEIAALNVADASNVSVDNAAHQVQRFLSAHGDFLKHGMDAESRIKDENREYMAQRLMRPGRGECFALNTGTASEGGNTVPDEVSSMIESAMGNENVMRTVGTVVTAETGRAKTLITVDDSANYGVGKAENQAAAGLDPATGGRQIRFANIDSREIKMSDELLLDSGVDTLLMDIMQIATERVGRAEERAFTEATANAAPLDVLVGLLADATVGHTTAANSAINRADLNGIFASVRGRHRRNSVWLYPSSLLPSFMGLATTDQLPIWQPGNVAMDLPMTLFGKPMYENEELPALAANSKSLVFGDLKKFRIEDVPSAERMFRFDETNSADYASKGEVGFLYRRRVGCRLWTVSGTFDAVKVLQTHS